MKITDFDDIRPYNADEIPAAMQRIANSSSFPILAAYVYPGEPLEEVRKRIAGYQTVRDFQMETMSMVNKQVIENSITEFSCSGLDKLSPDQQYLYVSNHRDIMLDSSLLQYFLVTHGFDTTEITFGANLMMNQLVIDIGKSNKMFKVERPGGSSIAARSISLITFGSLSPRSTSRHGLRSAMAEPRMATTLPTRASSRCSACRVPRIKSRR